MGCQLPLFPRRCYLKFPSCKTTGNHFLTQIPNKKVALSSQWMLFPQEKTNKQKKQKIPQKHGKEQGTEVQSRTTNSPRWAQGTGWNEVHQGLWDKPISEEPRLSAYPQICDTMSQQRNNNNNVISLPQSSEGTWT